MDTVLLQPRSELSEHLELEIQPCTASKTVWASISVGNIYLWSISTDDCRPRSWLISPSNITKIPHVVRGSVQLQSTIPNRNRSVTLGR